MTPPFVPLNGSPAASPNASAATAPAPPSDVTFVTLCKYITENKAQAAATKSCANFGLASLGLLNHADNAHLIPLVYAELTAAA